MSVYPDPARLSDIELASELAEAARRITLTGANSH
jgi:hypothetical protein